MIKSVWEYPDRNLLLENESILIRPLKYPEDVSNLYAVGSLEANSGEDIFIHNLGAGPFHTIDDFDTDLKRRSISKEAICYVIFSKRLNKLVGSLSLMRITPAHGTLEIGSIWFGKEAQRTEINSNAMYLMFSYVFEQLQYRRLEWKCNNKNENSKRAALRLGFTFEGIFRQHFFDKGLNRDTAWFSIIDSEWSEVKELFKSRLLRSQEN